MERLMNMGGVRSGLWFVVHIDPYTKNPVRGYWYMCSQTAMWITLGSLWMG